MRELLGRSPSGPSDCHIGLPTGGGGAGVKERAFNFSPGPAALPVEVLAKARDETAQLRGAGMSVMEMSHRSREFMDMAEAAEADLRTLLNMPEEYQVLFLQGGATLSSPLCPEPARRQDQGGLHAHRPLVGQGHQGSAQLLRRQRGGQREASGCNHIPR